jgi:hypothetical protein
MHRQRVTAESAEDAEASPSDSFFSPFIILRALGDLRGSKIFLLLSRNRLR